MTLTLSACASTGAKVLPPTKAGKPIVRVPDDCERLPGTIAKPRLSKGDDAKVHVVKRGGIIDKLNARIEARDKCAGARQTAFGGAP